MLKEIQKNLMTGLGVVLLTKDKIEEITRQELEKLKSEVNILQKRVELLEDTRDAAESK